MDTETSDDLNEIFRSGKILQATDAELERYLKHLASEPVPNDAVRHRATIRAHMIDTVRLFRFTERLEKSNRRLSWLVVALTITSVVSSVATGGASWFAGRFSSEQASELLASQRESNEQGRSFIEVQQQTNNRLDSLRALIADAVAAHHEQEEETR